MGKRKIGIVTFPLEKASIASLYNICSIISYLNYQVHIITGNAGTDVAQKLKGLNFELISHTSGSNPITRIFNFTKTLLTLTSCMMKQSKKGDIWIFPICGEVLLPCVILAKIWQKPVIMLLPSSTKSIKKYQSDPLNHIIVFFVKLNYHLATRIILYSPRLVSEWNLEPYSHKILFAHEHFLNTETFTDTIPFSDRPLLIGYIGRLNEEKGIINFLKALPIIVNEINEIRVLIVGDGPLRESVETLLEKEKISNRVDLTGWISHDELPKYLNQLRLLVIPSFTEGLPNIMLEAISCGTAVLATSVGAIPDIIKDGETGFIMENNSPRCISENILRAFKDPNLEKIALNAKKMVERDYSFEGTVKPWKRILDEV